MSSGRDGNALPEAGIAALEVSPEWKSICVGFSGRLRKAQIDEVEI